MYGMRIKDGFIDFGSREYTCPHCNHVHEDKGDKILEKCNKKHIAKKRCKSCKFYFFITYDMTGKFVTFLNPYKKRTDEQ